MSVTDVMEAHRYRGMDSNWMVRCSCGWTVDRINMHQMAMTLHDLHVLEAMSNAGFVVVELPKPHETQEATEDENGWRLWKSTFTEGPLVFDDGDVHYSGTTTVDAVKVREHAACLLAASLASEQAQS